MNNLEQVLVEVKIQTLLSEDPLFAIIRGTPTEQILLSDPFIQEINDKKYYSRAEVASWFGVTEGQLRYYIRPFESYVFEEAMENSTSTTALPLDFKAILKLRMILLLKEEYRVKGLKLLLNMSKQSQIAKQQTAATNELAVPDDIAQRVNMLSQVITQMIQTGLFQIEQEQESQQMKVSLNQEFLAQQIKAIPSETTAILTEITEDTQFLKSENETLKKQLEVLSQDKKDDIAILIRERHIENEIVAGLRGEALHKYNDIKGSQFFSKIFRSAQLQQKQEQFITDYVNTHLKDRLDKALLAYHQLN